MHGSKIMGLISLDSCACTCIVNGLRISSDKASNLPKRDVRFILLK